jgi:hypothetical protein
MDLTPIDLSDSSFAALPSADVAAFTGQAPGSSGLMAMRWTAIHDAVDAVAFFAGITPAEDGPEISDFPEIMRQCGGWRRDLANQGVEDLIAILEPGVTALLSAHEGGANAKPAAIVLWQEFLAARGALLALAPSASEG